MSGKPDWAVEGANWPNRAASRFLEAGGLSWHVQVLGEGPPLLLLHGAGAATHTWRDLAPLLAQRFTVIAPDLPGHGFTGAPPAGGLSLPAMAKSVAALLKALELEPIGVVAHSAGAAIALRLCLDRAIAPARVVAINGALQPFPGMAALVFPAMARALFLNPFAVQMFAWQARQGDAVRRLIYATGSSIDEAGVAAYAALLGKSGHIEGALGMMASWDLQGLARALPQLQTPVTLAFGARDLAVPPSVAVETAALLRDVQLIELPRLGHLAHEEDPQGVAELVFAALPAQEG